MTTFRFSFAALAALVALPFASFVGCTDGDVIPIGSSAQDVSCSADSDCPSGEVCSAGLCAPDPAGCVPAAETCNGVDDDCDGAVDDGATCADGSACVNGGCGGGAGGAGGGGNSGAGGSAPCDPANPSVETCNGVDDDCDGALDEGALCALAEVCLNGQCVICDPAGNCGTPCASDSDCPNGEVCQSGVCGSGCNAQPESCNGVDDDCDGAVDDGATCPDGSACVNGGCGGGGGAGGAGGGGGGCDPANPQPEACNGSDDDCDGVVDDGALCAFAEVCMNGQCVICDPAGNCGVPCASNVDCPAGQVCQNGMCN